MANYREVLARLETVENVKVEQMSGSTILRFSPETSRHNLVALTADVMSSEGLPFNGYYSIRDVGESVVLEIFHEDPLI